jgi:uncharacterized protein YkwD
MHRVYRTRLWSAVILVAGLAATGAASSDALSAVQVLRAGGCGGAFPLAPPLRHDARLDRVAADWAAGAPLTMAAERYGFPSRAAGGVRVVGDEASLLELMRRSACPTVMARGLRDIGIYRVGREHWLVMISDGSTQPGFTTLTPRQPSAATAPSFSPPAAAAPSFSPPTSAAPARPASESGSAPALVSRALKLVNDARARGTRCGAHDFAPAPPVTFSGTLAGVAFGHASDMAEHGYFEHEDLAGHSPADRVRAVGYREKLVGENIAYGPITVEEVVRAWLDSPDHCENIMDPRFAQMGIAFATGRTSRRGLYWVQVLAEPRA